MVVFGILLSLINGAFMTSYAIVLGLAIDSFDPSLNDQEKEQSLWKLVYAATFICVC